MNAKDRLYFIGDSDSMIAIPARLSTSDMVFDGERAWACLESDCTGSIIKALESRYESRMTANRAFRTSAQNMIGWIKTQLEDGEFSSCVFTLTVFDSPEAGTETVLIRRRITRAETTPRTEP